MATLTSKVETLQQKQASNASVMVQEEEDNEDEDLSGNLVSLLCTVCVFHTIRVWYIPYVYGTYHTRMVCFSVPYTYGCTVCVYVSHSIKLSIGSGGSMPKVYSTQ